MSKKLVVIENNQALTDSRIVAQKFDKNHRDVLKTINNLIQQMASASQSANLRSATMFIKKTRINKLS